MRGSTPELKERATDDLGLSRAGTIRFAVISDTHLPRRHRALPEECVARMRDADLILHAGDIRTVAVFDELERLGPPVRAVHGNVDELALQRRLPANLELQLGRLAIAMTHDAGPVRGRLARMRRLFPKVAAVIFGHSHLPLHEAHDDGFQIFNPGSPTEPRRAPHPTMGMGYVVGTSLSFELLAI